MSRQFGFSRHTLLCAKQRQQGPNAQHRQLHSTRYNNHRQKTWKKTTRNYTHLSPFVVLQELTQHFKSTVLQSKEEKRTLQELRNCFLQPRIRKQLILVQTLSVWGAQHSRHREERRRGDPHLSPGRFLVTARRSLDKPHNLPLLGPDIILTCGGLLSTKQCSG